MALTKEQRNQRDREKRAAWKQEIETLRLKQERREDRERERLSLSNAAVTSMERQIALLETVHVKMLGAEFRAWYEATTGENADEFLNEVVISSTDYNNRAAHLKINQLEWTQSRIELIAMKNPWSDPEVKKYWGEQLPNLTVRQRRGALIRMATPHWANQDKVVDFYRERDRLTEATGILHEVDHIVPIVSRKVCGLHCEFNLRVITKTENREKSNKFD